MILDDSENKYEFSGTSDNGDVSEAISLAVGNAIEKLPTDMVNWKVKDITGSYGGFTEQAKLTVTIIASLP